MADLNKAKIIEELNEIFKNKSIDRKKLVMFIKTVLGFQGVGISKHDNFEAYNDFFLKESTMETTVKRTDAQDHTFLITQQQIEYILQKKEKIKGLELSNAINSKIQEWLQKSLDYDNKKSDMFYEGCLSVVEQTIRSMEEIKQIITDVYKNN